GGPARHARRGAPRPGRHGGRSAARGRGGAGADRGPGAGGVHDPVRTGRGTGEEGRVVTERDRRGLLLGGGVVLAALLLLRVLPWTVRSALAAEAGLRGRAALLARARADLADAAALRDSAVELGQALVGLAPRILSGTTV